MQIIHHYKIKSTIAFADEPCRSVAVLIILRHLLSAKVTVLLNSFVMQWLRANGGRIFTEYNGILYCVTKLPQVIKAVCRFCVRFYIMR